MKAADPLKSAQWLLANHRAPDVRIVEATWFPSWVRPQGDARRAYAEGHIPGAVFFDIDEIADTSSGLPHMLPPAAMFSSRVRRMGIGDGHRVIIYDRNDFCAAARVWWTFRVMGHEDVFVLDGGHAAWLAAGGEVEDMPPLTSDRHQTVRIKTHLLRTAEQVMSAARDDRATIIDARPAGRFEGTVPEPREGLPSGHIPGSVNLPASLLIADGHLKPGAEIAELFAARGIDPMAPIIATCGSGVTASILALALARLGNDTASVYDGSWSEWACDPSRPIATGPSTRGVSA